MADSLLTRFAGLFVFAATLGLCSTAAAGELNILQTGQSGGNTQLDVDHSYFWRFSYSGSAQFDPVRASFVMKKGPSTSSPATMQFFRADSNGVNNGDALSIVSVADTEFTQQYTNINFDLFNSPTSLPSRFNISLTSDTPSSGNGQYFIKGDLASATFGFEDENGNPITGITFLGAGQGTGDSGSTPLASTPEPSSILGMLSVISLCGYSRFRSRQKTETDSKT